MRTVQAWLSPTRVIALAALFFAVGGSALAVGHKTTASKARCATGAVKGIAIVTGDAKKGLANLPTEYTAASNLFLYRFNCAGGVVQVRRSEQGFDLRFAGTALRSATVSVVGGTPGTASVNGLARDQWHVTIAGPSAGGAYVARQDLPFIVTVF